jgi:hypothetical protein
LRLGESKRRLASADVYNAFGRLSFGHDCGMNWDDGCKRVIAWRGKLSFSDGGGTVSRVQCGVPTL